MQPHTIKVTITPEGKVVTEVQGVKGPACEDLTRFLDALGPMVEDRPTAAYYEPDLDAQVLTQDW